MWMCKYCKKYTVRYTKFTFDNKEADNRLMLHTYDAVKSVNEKVVIA